MAYGGSKEQVHGGGRDEPEAPNALLASFFLGCWVRLVPWVGPGGDGVRSAGQSGRGRGGPCPGGASAIAPEALIVKPAPGDVRVRIQTDRSRYRVGESVQIRFWVSEPAYVYIYNVDSRGRVRLIFPNRFDANNRVPGRRAPAPRRRVPLPGGRAARHRVPPDPGHPDPPPASGALERPGSLPLLGGDPLAVKEEVLQFLDVVPERSWSSAWTQFEVIGRQARGPRRETGTVRINSEPPWAQVYLDGAYVGLTPSCRRCLRAVTGWRSAWRGTGLPGAGSLWSRESPPPSSSTWSAGKGGGGGGAGRAPTCARKPAGTPPPAPAVLEGLTQPWGQREGRRPPPRVSTRFFSFLDPIPRGPLPPPAVTFLPTSSPPLDRSRRRSLRLKGTAL